MMMRDHDVYRPRYDREDSRLQNSSSKDRGPDLLDTTSKEHSREGTAPDRHRSSSRSDHKSDTQAPEVQNGPQARSEDHSYQKESMSVQDMSIKASKPVSSPEKHSLMNVKTHDPRRRPNVKSPQNAQQPSPMDSIDDGQELDFASIQKKVIVEVSARAGDYKEFQILKDQLSRDERARDAAEKKAPHSPYAKQLEHRRRQTEMKLNVIQNRLSQSKDAEVAQLDRLKRAANTVAQRQFVQQNESCYHQMKALGEKLTSQFQSQQTRHDTEVRVLKDQMKKQEDDLASLRAVLQLRDESTTNFSKDGDGSSNGSAQLLRNTTSLNGLTRIDRLESTAFTTNKEAAESRKKYEELYEEVQLLKKPELSPQSLQKQSEVQKLELDTLSAATTQKVESMSSRVRTIEEELETMSRTKYLSISDFDGYVRMFNDYRDGLERFKNETKRQLDHLSSEDRHQLDESEKEKLEMLDARTTAQSSIVRDLTSKSNGYELAISSLNTQFNNMTTEPIVRQMTSVVDSRSAILREDVNKIRSELITTLESVKDLITKHNKLVQDFAEHRNRTLDLTNKIGQANDVAETTTQGQIALNARVENTDANVEHFKALMSEVEKQQLEVQTRCSDATKAAEAAETRTWEMETSVGDLKKKVDYLESTLHRSAPEQSVLESQQDGIVRHQSSLTTDVNEVRDLARTTRSDLTSFSKQIMDWQDRIKECLADLEQTIIAHADKPENLRKELLDNMADKEKLHKQTHEKLETNDGSIESDFKRAQDLLDLRITEIEDKIALLERQNDSFTAKFRSLTAIASTPPSIIKAFGHHDNDVMKEGNRGDTIEVSTPVGRNMGTGTPAKHSLAKQAQATSKSESLTPTPTANTNFKRASQLSQATKSAASSKDEISESDQAEEDEGDSDNLLKRFGATSAQKPASRKNAPKVSSPAITAKKKSTNSSSRRSSDQSQTIQTGLKRKREASQLGLEKTRPIEIHGDESEASQKPIKRQIRK